MLSLALSITNSESRVDDDECDLWMFRTRALNIHEDSGKTKILPEKNDSDILTIILFFFFSSLHPPWDRKPIYIVFNVMQVFGLG